jgi:hypothetical protein
MWSIESLEDMAHSNDELQFFPCHVVFKEKKKIRMDRLKPDDEPYISCYTYPSPNFDDKEMVYSNLDDSNIKKDVKKAPNEGFNLPLNRTFTEIAGDNDSDNDDVIEVNKINYGVDVEINVQ